MAKRSRVRGIDGERRETAARRADEMLARLRSAIDMSSEQIEEFRRTGSPYSLAFALDLVGGLSRSEENDRHAIMDMVGLTPTQQRRDDYAGRVARNWFEWKRDVHHATSLHVEHPVLESDGRKEITVFLLGKRIGFLRSVSIGSEEGLASIDGYQVMDPFRTMYKRPLYEDLEAAVARLVDEISDRLAEVVVARDSSA